MYRSRLSRIAVALATVVVTLTVVPVGGAESAPRSSAASGPANLCTLTVGPRLKALGVTTKCTHTNTRVGKGAHWGTATRGINITVWASTSEARFKSAYKSLGTPVKLGSFAREADGPMGVTLNAWVNGVGLSVVLIHRAGSNKALRLPVLAFSKTVAKQI